MVHMSVFQSAGSLETLMDERLAAMTVEMTVVVMVMRTVALMVAQLGWTSADTMASVTVVPTEGQLESWLDVLSAIELVGSTVQS